MKKITKLIPSISLWNRIPKPTSVTYVLDEPVELEEDVPFAFIIHGDETGIYNVTCQDPFEAELVATRKIRKVVE